jgi:hypothetical protein
MVRGQVVRNQRLSPACTPCNPCRTNCDPMSLHPFDMRLANDNVRRESHRRHSPCRPSKVYTRTRPLPTPVQVMSQTPLLESTYSSSLGWALRTASPANHENCDSHPNGAHHDLDAWYGIIRPSIQTPFRTQRKETCTVSWVFPVEITGFS